MKPRAKQEVKNFWVRAQTAVALFSSSRHLKRKMSSKEVDTYFLHSFPAVVRLFSFIYFVFILNPTKGIKSIRHQSFGGKQLKTYEPSGQTLLLCHTLYAYKMNGIQLPALRRGGGGRKISRPSEMGRELKKVGTH